MNISFQNNADKALNHFLLHPQAYHQELNRHIFNRYRSISFYHLQQVYYLVHKAEKISHLQASANTSVELYGHYSF